MGTETNHRDAATCLLEGGFLSMSDGPIPESRYDMMFEYLLTQCDVSIFGAALTFYYCNSGLSVLLYIVAVGFLGWNMFKKKERRFYPFIILIVLSETVNIGVKNYYQKFGLPIYIGSENNRGRWVRGWYKDYSPATKIILEEIMLGANLIQEIFLLAVNIATILKMCRKAFWYVYPLFVLLFFPLQYGYSYLRWAEGEDLGKFLGIYPFFPPLFALFTWIGCIVLEKLATFTVFPRFRGEERNKRFIEIMAATSILAVLSLIEVYPEGHVTVVYATLFKIVEYHLETITGWFEQPWVYESSIFCQHILIIIFEVSKYFSAVKMLCLIRFLKEE